MSVSIEFCPELQRDWIIESISFDGLEDVKVYLVCYQAEEYPDVIGRDGKDVLSWPSITSSLCEVEITFSGCQYLNIREEFSPGLSEDDKGEGASFQRLLESQLLSMFSERAMDGLFHYRIIGSLKIIDFLVEEPPHVVWRKNT